MAQGHGRTVRGRPYMWSVSLQTAETCGRDAGKLHARLLGAVASTFSPMGSGCTSVSRVPVIFVPSRVFLMCVPVTAVAVAVTCSCSCSSSSWVHSCLVILLWVHIRSNTAHQSPHVRIATQPGDPCMRRTWEFPSSLLLVLKYQDKQPASQQASSHQQAAGTSSSHPLPLPPTLLQVRLPPRLGGCQISPCDHTGPVAFIPHSNQSRRAQPLTQADTSLYFAHGWSLPSRLSPRGHHPPAPCHRLDLCSSLFFSFSNNPLLGRPREANAGGRSLAHTKKKGSSACLLINKAFFWIPGKMG